MAEQCSWDAIPSSSGNGEMSDFLRLKSGNSYKIRPIFEPVKFYKYFHKEGGKLRTAIVGKHDIETLKAKYPDLKKPSLRLAAYVIDRADGKLKILEAPQTVFRPIGASAEMTGKNPGGGKDGSDWYIKVSGTGLNTTYDVGMIGPSPITQDERVLIKNAMTGEDDEFDKEKLQKLYKVDSIAQIEEKLFGSDDGEGKSAPTAAPAQATIAPQEAPVSAADGDDFDNEW